MDKLKAFSVKEIKRHYTGTKALLEQEKHGFFYRKIIRPVSFYLTPPFLAIGCSANQVTLLSFISGLTGCGLLATGNYSLTILGIFLLFLFLLLDFIDGNIARFHQKTNHLGKFLDGVSGSVVYTLIPLCLGIGSGYASHENDILRLSSNTSLLIGAIFTYLFTFSFLIRWRFRAQKLLMSEGGESETGEKEGAENDPSSAPKIISGLNTAMRKRLKRSALNVLHRVDLAWQNTYLPFLLFLLLPGFSGTVFLILCIICGVYSLSFILFTFYNAATILRKFRPY